MPSAKPVTIVATSDLHGLLEGIGESVRNANADVLVIAGDIQPANIFPSPEEWFHQDFLPLIEKLPCEVVAIPGNHDFFLANKMINPEWRKGFPNNFHLLVDSGVVLKGLKFYGTPWVPWISGRWVFESEDEALEERFNQIPKGLDVLITHSPPYIVNENIDVSLQHDPRYHQHFGSRELADAISIKKPRYLFCGHIHSGCHIRCQVKYDDGTGDCSCYNVSRVDERYAITYEPLVVKGINNL